MRPITTPQWLRALLRGTTRPADRLARRSDGLTLEALEERLAPAANPLFYQAVADAPLQLTLVNGQLRVVDPTDAQIVLAAQPAATTGQVVIRANGHAVRLTIDASVPRLAGGIAFDGSGNSTLVGPAGDQTWHVTGSGSGDLGGPGFVTFTGVRQLVGAADNRDTFVFAPAGQMTGGVDGGAGGFDTLAFDGAYRSVAYNPTSPDAGTVVLDGANTIPFAGLEPVASSVNADTVIVTFTNTDDSITLSTDASDPNRLLLNANFAEDFSFLKPNVSLTINMGGGDLTVGAVDLGRASLVVNAAEKATLTGSLSAATVYVRALQTIDVRDGAVVSAQPARGAAFTGGQTLTFRGNTIIRPFGRTWADDGFAPGQLVTIAGTDSPDLNNDGKPDNDGKFVVADVVGTTLTLDRLQPFVTQYQAAPSVTGVDGNVVLTVDASIDLRWSAVTPFFRDRSASGGITIGAASLRGNNVLVNARSNTRKIADFEVNEFAIGNVALPASMGTDVLPDFVDNGIDPQTNLPRPDTIVRVDGSWLDDGFVAGQFIQVSNSQLNNGLYRVAAVSGNTLSLDPSATLRPESATSSVTIESVTVMTGNPSLDFRIDPTTQASVIHRSDGVDWASQGFKKGQTFTVTGTPDGPDADTEGDNDGDFTVYAVAGADLIVDPGTAVAGTTAANLDSPLVVQTGVTGVTVTAQGSPADIPLAMINPDVALQPEAVTLTFSDNGAAADTITRAAGSWLADQFAPNQQIVVSGTNFNNNVYTIASISGDGRTLTLAADATLHNERTVSGSQVDIQAASALSTADGNDVPFLVFSAVGRSITRKDDRTWTADGFVAGQTISVTGTTSNDGAYRIASVSPDGKTLVLAAGTVLVVEDTQVTPSETGVAITATTSLASPELLFTGDTITRSAGNWVDDGFTVGSKISVNETAANNGQFIIADILDGGRTLRLDLGTTPDGTPIRLNTEYARFVEVNGLTILENTDGSPVTVGDLGGSLMYRLAGVSDTLSSFIAQATLQDSTSTLTVATGANIQATGDVEIRSVADSTLGAKVESIWLGVAYGRSNATARTVVQDGTTITAGGRVDIAANVINTMQVATKIKMGMNPKLMFIQQRLTGRASLIPGPALTAAVGEATSVSETLVGGPNSFISATDVAITADNANTFVVASKAGIKGMSAANTGGAVAIIVSNVSSSATVQVAGTIHATNDIAVTGRSVNLSNEVSGKAKVKRDAKKKGKLGEAVQSQVTTLLPQLNLDAVANAGKISFGAAVLIASSVNQATALIVPDARLFARHDLTVTGYAEDNYKAIGIAGAKANSTVALAGAILISDYTNRADTHVAGGAVLTAGHALSVLAQAKIPNQITLDDVFRTLIHPPGLHPKPTVVTDNSDPLAASQSAQQASQDEMGWAQDNLAEQMTWLSTGILPLIKLKKALPTFFSTTQTAASAGESVKEKVLDSQGKPAVDGKGKKIERVVSQTEAAISGSVKIHRAHNIAHADVGELALLNVVTNDGPFTVAAAPDQSVAVRATTSIETVDAAGLSKLPNPLETGTKGASAVGGSFSGLTFSNEAIAFVDDGAEVRAAGDVAVTADNRNLYVTLSQQGAKASVVGISGAVTIFRDTNTAIAYVEDQARIDAGGNVGVNASNSVLAVNVCAVVQKGGEVAVGIGVGINSVSNTTRAFIGNHDPATAAIASAGHVHTGGDLTVAATADTKLFAIGVGMTKVQGEKPDKAPKDVPPKAAGKLGLDDTSTTARQPKFGLGISGSVALNSLKDNTQAYILGAN
ncbi:MAG: hypothetical protein U0736_28540, partial [Gemmataceae bacterium]